MTGPDAATMRPPIPQEVQSFNRLVLPFIHINNPDVSQALIREGTREAGELYASLGSNLGQSGRFVRGISRGRFEPLLALAAEATADIANARLTIPDVFAVHAIASCLANVNRPLSVPHNRDRTTYFLTQFASRLAIQTPESTLQAGPDPFLFAQAIGQRTTALANAIGENSSWLQAKLFVLADRLLMRKHIGEVINAEPTIEVSDIAELTRNNNALLHELRRLQRYSIKSAVHTDEGSSWSIHDMFNVQTQLVTMTEAANSSIQPDRWEPQMIMSAIEHADEGMTMLQINFDPSVRPNYDEFHRYVFMDDNGRLFADQHGAMPLLPFYEAAGKQGNYEVLRQFLLQKYCDLTVPLEVVAKAEQATRRMLRRGDERDTTEPGTVCYDLLLPRIRLLRTYTPEDFDALEAAETQAQEVQDTPSSAASTSSRKHHVTEAFRRTLPEGYRASAHARALAEKLGISLAENETLVKKHDRGNPALGEVIHRARKRPQ